MRRATAVLLLVTAAGCLDLDEAGSGGPEGPDGDADVDSDADADSDADTHWVPIAEEAEVLSEVCTAMTDALCTGLAACCEGGWTQEVAERCHTFYADGCVNQYSEALERNGVRLRPIEMDACATAYEEWMETCPPDFGGAPSCIVLGGSLPEGADCEEWGQCADGLVCMGTCERLPEEGWPCSLALCAGDLICLDSVCTVPAREGEACALSATGSGKPDTCDWQTFCDPDGRCARLRQIGAACTEPRECETFRCEDGACVTRPSTPVDACYPFLF